MSHSTDAHTLARWMAGEFSNEAQALANPPLWAHIKVCMRPLPNQFFDGYGLYLEQAYSSDTSAPYRLRLFHIKPVDDHMELVHYKPKDDAKTKYMGAARNPAMMQHFDRADLDPMPGCDMIVTWSGTSFKGTVQAGKGCRVVRYNKESYLDNSFEITDNALISIDRGRDPVTDEILWGSLAGAFEFEKINNFSGEVQPH